MQRPNDRICRSSMSDAIDKSAERNLVLQGEWEALMPCNDCDIKDVCKYKNCIKRTDFSEAIS